MHLASNVDGSKLSGEVDGVLIVETEIEVELEGVVGITPSWWADVGALTHEERQVPGQRAKDDPVGRVLDSLPLVDKLLVEAGQHLWVVAVEDHSPEQDLIEAVLIGVDADRVADRVRVDAMVGVVRKLGPAELEQSLLHCLEVSRSKVEVDL